jgi:hypothetical protein
MSRKPAKEDREHDEIQRQVGQVDQAEQRAARHRLDAVLAAGEGRLQREEEDHLREGQRDHGEVDALPADRERAEDEPSTRARRCRRGWRAPASAPDLGGMGAT